MKFLFMVILVMNITTMAWAENSARKELQQYPRWIRNECLKLTNYRDRKASYNDYPAALQCAKNTVEKLERQRALDAELTLTEEKIKWLKAHRYDTDCSSGIEQ